MRHTYSILRAKIQRSHLRKIFKIQSCAFFSHVCVSLCEANQTQRTKKRKSSPRTNFPPPPHTQTRARTHAHKHAHINAHTHTNAHTRAHAHTRASARTHTYINTHARTYERVHTYKCTHMHARTHTHAHTHSRAHKHTHARAHTHTQTHTNETRNDMIIPNRAYSKNVSFASHLFRAAFRGSYFRSREPETAPSLSPLTSKLLQHFINHICFLRAVCFFFYFSILKLWVLAGRCSKHPMFHSSLMRKMARNKRKIEEMSFVEIGSVYNESSELDPQVLNATIGQKEIACGLQTYLDGQG